MNGLALISLIALLLNAFSQSPLNAQQVNRADGTEPRQVDSTGFASALDTIVGAMARDHLLTAPRVGAGGMEPEQWRRYVRFRGSATDEDLLELVAHGSPVVRSYAFRALAERKHSSTYPVLVRLMTDTAMMPVFASWRGEMAVTDYVLDVVDSSDKHFASGFVLDLGQRSLVDSILLYTPRLDVQHRFQLLLSLPATEPNYPRVRQLVIDEQEGAAVLALARYRRSEDRPLILSALRSSQEDFSYGALEAVEEYPDTMFYSDLVRLFRSMRREYAEWSGRFSQLCGALARYPRRSTVALFREALRARDRDRRQAIMWAVGDAIQQYPHRDFLALLPLVKLDKEDAAAFRKAIHDDKTK